MPFHRIAGLGVLAGVLIGTVLSGCKSTDSGDDIAAAKAQSINNLKKIAMGLHNYASANGGSTLPPAGDPSNVPPYSWRVSLLPFVHETALYDQIDHKAFVLPDPVRNAAIAVYQHPITGKRNVPETHYRVFVGNGAAFEAKRGVSFGEFRDGYQNTILVVESAEPVAWHSMEDFAYDPNKPLPKLGIFPGGFHAMMGDGTIVWFPDNTDEKTLHALITRSGGEKVTPPAPVGGQ